MSEKGFRYCPLTTLPPKNLSYVLCVLLWFFVKLCLLVVLGVKHFVYVVWAKAFAIYFLNYFYFISLSFAWVDPCLCVQRKIKISIPPVRCSTSSLHRHLSCLTSDTIWSGTHRNYPRGHRWKHGLRRGIGGKQGGMTIISRVTHRSLFRVSASLKKHWIQVPLENLKYSCWP